MIYVYTTGDGVPYTAGDGTLLVVGTSPTLIDGLITDRNAADIDETQMLTDSIKAGTATEEQVLAYLNEVHKGAYTYRDLNRVEEAVQYVAMRLQGFGYLNNILVARYWAMEDKPNADDFARYFYNVATLRDAITVWESTPEAPSSVVGFDFNKANALEQILVDVDLILTKISNSWFFSGDLYSAEV